MSFSARRRVHLDRITSMRAQSLGLAALVATWATACISVGPKTVPRDRFEYSTSITESWKRQALLNIVKLRYMDPPIFVDVGQIVSGYSLETAVNLGGQLASPGAVQGDILSLGGSGRFVDRPTITYIPLTGNKFVKGLMTPLPPTSVFFTIQSGWPADSVLFAATASLNGLRNQAASIAGVTPAAPDFLRALELLRKLQLSGAVGMRILQRPDKQETALVTFRSGGIAQETLDDIAELRHLLRMSPDASEFSLVFGATPSKDTELAVLTRSMLQIMNTMAIDVEVPPEHVSEGRAAPGRESVAPGEGGASMIRIRSSRERPPDAFVAVEYRDCWFWVDDRDLKSKRSLAFMMLLFSMAETGERESLPLITIPAQ